MADNVVTKIIDCKAKYLRGYNLLECTQKAADFVAEKQDYYCTATPVPGSDFNNTSATAYFLIICNKKPEPQVCEKKTEK